MPPAPHPLEPDEDRSARHLFVLKSLTDRAYTLAMKAAAKAEAQLDAPDPTPDADDPAPAAPNHHQTFERYVRIARLLIQLEYRIANHIPVAPRTYRPAGGSAAPDRAPPGSTGQPDRPRAAADPRRAPLQQFLHKITRNSPGRAGLRRDVNTFLDEALERDPAYTLPAGVILGEICDEYGLPFDLAHLPDAFLEPPIVTPLIRPPLQSG